MILRTAVNGKQNEPSYSRRTCLNHIDWLGRKAERGRKRNGDRQDEEKEIRRNLRKPPKPHSFPLALRGRRNLESRKFQVSSLSFDFSNACHCNLIDLPWLCVKFHESDIQCWALWQAHSPHTKSLIGVILREARGEERPVRTLKLTATNGL